MSLEALLWGCLSLYGYDGVVGFHQPSVAAESDVIVFS